MLPTSPRLSFMTARFLGWTLLALVAASTSVVSAQTVDLRGTVRDAETGEPLFGATVRVEGLGPLRGAATDERGRYAVPGLVPGASTVTASFVGYRETRRSVTLSAGDDRRLDFALAPEDAAVGEVDVEARAAAAVSLERVDLALVQELPTAFEADLFRSIQLLPGVKAANDFSSALYIRGGSPDQTLVLLDGATVYNPTHFFGFFSTFNTDAVGDVRLYKGAYPSTYGGRLGSVVDVRTRAGERDRLRGSATLGLLASRAGLEGPLPGLPGTFALHARRSTLEPVLAVLRDQLDADGIPESFAFYDVNGTVALDLSPRDRVRASAYAGRDRVAVPFGDDARFNLDYGNQTGSVAYDRVLSERASAQLGVVATRYVSDPVGEIAETAFRQPNTVTEWAARATADWQLSARLGVSAGARVGRFVLDFESEFNGDVGSSLRNPATVGSAFVQGRWLAGPWAATGGVRVEAFQNRADDRLDDRDPEAATFVRFAPHVEVSRVVGPATVQLAAGRYHQFLSLVSNEAFSGFDTWLTTGPGVAPQASEQVVLGVEAPIGTSVRLDVEVYGRTLRELFDTRPEVQDVSGLDYAQLFRFGEGYAGGLEVLVEKGRGRLTGLVGYTLGVTRRRYPAEPAFRDFFPPKYDRLHDLTAVAQLALGRGWSATVAGAYATGQAYTVPGRRYRVGGLPFAEDALDALDSDRLNNTRLPAYHRVDVGATKEGRLLGARSELRLQVVNVYNRRNLWFETYDFDADPVEVGQVRQLPILPNVSLSLDW